MGAPKAEGITLSDFEFSEQGQIISCPQGQCPQKIKEKKGRITVSFQLQHCQCCPYLSQCPVKEGKKYYYLRYTQKERRITQRRTYEDTDEFKDRYRWRAGIEATMSEYSRRTGVKRLRVRGLKAVRFCATLKALAVNIFRATTFRIALETNHLDNASVEVIIFKIFYYVKESFVAFQQIFKVEIVSVKKSAYLML